MAYATLSQAQTLYGEDAIAIAFDFDGDGNPDTSRFEMHLEIGARQMDGYMLGRYPLPLATPPDHFVKVNVDIALYNACIDAAKRTDEMRRRYEDAVKYMELIAANKVKLEIAPNATTANQANSPSIAIGRTVEYATGARQFTSNSLKGLL